MDPDGSEEVRTERYRMMARAGLAATITIACLGYVALEGFFYKLPIHPSKQPRVIWLILFGPIGCILLKKMERIRPYDPAVADLANFILEIGDKLKRLVIEQFTAIAIILLTGLIGFCVVWLPQFLVQPLWTDHEHVLVMARLWDIGEFPWTAMRTYQFPGEMEIAWLSAKLFGWGYPPGYFLMDMFIMAILSITLIYWSARQLGHWRYGVLAVMGLVSYEAALPFTGVAQRDAHATELAMLAFCLPGVFQRRRFGEILSGVAFALGMAIRPHVILFVPMIITGIWWSEWTQSEGVSRETSYFKCIMRRVLILSASAIVAGLLFFEPVLGRSRTAEFLAALQFPLTQDSAYNRGMFVDWVDAAMTYYVVPRHFWYIIFCVWMVVGSRNLVWKQRGFVMLLIALTGGFYRMVHPVDHGYLQQPLMILEIIGLAVFPAWMMTEMSHFRGLTWFAVSGLMLYLGQIETTIYTELSYTPIAYDNLLNGKMLPYSPPGCRSGYPNNGNDYHYLWPDWIQAEEWLRVESTRKTKVLNLLSYQPFPAFLATVDRFPIGRLESIILMNWFTKYDFDTEIAEDLEKAAVGSLVVWDAGRTNPMNIPQLIKTQKTILRLYEKRMDFGEIEFWEKLAPYSISEKARID